MLGHRGEPLLREADPTTPESPSPAARPAGRRCAAVPVDSVPIEAAFAPYAGKRRAAGSTVSSTATLTDERPETQAATQAAGADLGPDTATIEKVLRDLQPVDQTTSFAHEDTTRLTIPERSRRARVETAPVVATYTNGGGGKRRAVKQVKTRRRPLLPPLPVAAGIAALAVAVTGAVKADGPAVIASPDVKTAHAATALNGDSATASITKRSKVVSRDSARVAQGDAAGQELKDAAEGLAQQRNTALTQLRDQTESYAKELAKDAWVYPLEPVILTARFGQYGLWASYHTGLDFNGNTGDQIHAIAAGTVTSTGYDGSYGNKTVVQLEDGTELWYCHQSAFGVSVGDTVRPGEVIGLVGATGNVTGSHLHVEVRPGGGDPVDPYPAMQQHGLF